MTVLQALVGQYDRLASRGEAPRYGFSNEKISYTILLSPDGGVVDVQCLRDMSWKKPRPSFQLVPRPVTRSGLKFVSNFLWDNTAYVLGVARENKGSSERKHSEFKALHEALLAHSEDEGLRTFMAFLNAWRPEHYDALPYAEDMVGTNIVFRLDDGTREFLHERQAAQIIWTNYLARGGAEGLCLVTGERGPIARLHLDIKGVNGAQSRGGKIVSFNRDAFESFAKRQGANAPVSERAAFAYTTALNTLLAPGSRQRVQIGDTTTVFWAEATNRGTTEAEQLLLAMFDGPPSAKMVEEAKVAEVRVKLEAIAEGRPLSEVAPEVEEDTRVYVLGLAPNAARLSVRFWHVDSIGVLVKRMKEHWQDLCLDPPPWPSPPPVWRLLFETAVQRKAENIQPTLGGALMRSILTGGPYPRALLAAVVGRIRADSSKNLNGERAAICKAVLARNQRLRRSALERENVPVTLQEKSGDIAYNLGRLFAAYAFAEEKFAPRNATIRDKYGGAASATPLRVFPVLMRGYEHNRAGLAKSGGKKAGAGVRAEQAVGEIIGLLPGCRDLPRSLTLEEQARFFIGYYHQDRAFYTKRDSGEEN